MPPANLECLLQYGAQPGRRPPDTTPPTAPSSLTATAAERHADQSRLDRRHRYGRRDRLPGRALPGRRLQHLRPDRDADRRRRSATPGSPPPPVTATASARPMPPGTSDRIPTPPAPRPRRPGRRPGSISFVQVNAATPQTAADHGRRHVPGGAVGRQPECRRGWLERRRSLSRVGDRHRWQRLCAGGRPDGEYRWRPQPGDLLRQEHRGRSRRRQHRHGHLRRGRGISRYPHSRVQRRGCHAAPVDVTATGTGSSATSSTAAVTTTNASDLLFAANTVATVTTAPGAGFTSRIITTPEWRDRRRPDGHGDRELQRDRCAERRPARG